MQRIFSTVIFHKIILITAKIMMKIALKMTKYLHKSFSLNNGHSHTDDYIQITLSEMPENHEHVRASRNVVVTLIFYYGNDSRTIVNVFISVFMSNGKNLSDIRSEVMYMTSNFT